jgi:anti-sigma B factor antagonist
VAETDEAAIDCKRDGTVLRARVSGEVDLGDIDMLRTTLDGAIGDARTIDFDLSGITFMDSTGIRWILEVEQAMKRRDGEVTVSATSPQVRHVFEITGLVQHFGLPPADA